MDAEIAKAINNISKKVNSIELKLDRYFSNRCDENAANISVMDGGVMDMADIVSGHDEAIGELAAIVSYLSEGKAADQNG